MVFKVVGLTLQKMKSFSAQTSLFTHILFIYNIDWAVLSHKNQENVKNSTQNI